MINILFLLRLFIFGQLRIALYLHGAGLFKLVLLNLQFLYSLIVIQLSVDLFDLVPVFEHRVGVVGHDAAKDVRMAQDELSAGISP